MAVCARAGSGTQDSERLPTRLEHEPEPDDKPGNAAFRPDLEEIVVHVNVHVIGEFDRAPVVERLAADFLTHTEPRVVLDQAACGADQLDSILRVCIIRIKASAQPLLNALR